MPPRSAGRFSFEGSGEYDLAAGSVTGIRGWSIREDGPPGRYGLQGMFGGVWTPGEMAAECRRGHTPPCGTCLEGGEAAACSCGCGFWSYWTPEAMPHMPEFGPVAVGIVEGYGRTTIGSFGFRSTKARLRGLHVIRVTPERDAREISIYGFRFGYDAPQPDPAEDALLRTGIEFALEDAYQVPVYMTMDLMLARHPLTRDYLPEPR